MTKFILYSIDIFKCHLKTKMRNKRTRGTATTYYHISDNTMIRHLSLKELLSDMRTKAELCDYLALKVLNYSKVPDNNLGYFMVTYNTKTVGNMSIVPTLQMHDHEEADAL